LKSPLPEGLQEGLQANDLADAELIIAGFPGYTADRLLALSKLCSLRCLASLNGGSELPWYGDLKSPLRSTGVHLWSGDAHRDEDVDVVFIIAGYNDFSHDDASPKQVYKTLTSLQDLYSKRGAVAIIVTPGEGRPEYEKQRQVLNSWLLERHRVVDCDSLVCKLRDDAWANMEHFTEEGSKTLGTLLADAFCNNADLWTSERARKSRYVKTEQCDRFISSNIGRNKRRYDSRQPLGPFRVKRQCAAFKRH
jgi:hypothetical protein